MTSIRDFSKVDAHIHFNADRDDVLRLARRYGFDLLTINTPVPDFPPPGRQLELARTYRRSGGVRLDRAVTVDTADLFRDDWEAQAEDFVRQQVEEGAVGVKFWKNIGLSLRRPDGSFVMPDAPELRPLLDFLEAQGVPVLGHQGEPRNCWLPLEEMTVQSDRDYYARHPEYHMYRHSDYPAYQEHIDARDALLERHPELTFVGLHLASLEWSLEAVARRLDRFPRMAVDLAERFSHLYLHAARDRQAVISFFRRYQDRIIYGTDIIDDPAKEADEVCRELEERWQTHWKFLSGDGEMRSNQIGRSFRGLNLPPKILRKIYRENAVRWYGLPY